VDDEQNRHSPEAGKLAFDLVDLGVVFGRLARVARRLADCQPILDASGASEFGWLLTEFLALDDRARTLLREKIEPEAREQVAKFLSSGRPPWPE
jgi:hypothetical protein